VTDIAGGKAAQGLTVYPAFKATYYGFYLAGLAKLFPGRRPHLRSKPFPPFHHHCLAFNIEDKRIYISAGDGSGINQEALNWCDVYAKVNLDPHTKHPKLFPIGPSFGIRFLSLGWAGLWALRSFCAARSVIKSARQHFGEYYHQAVRREPEEAYFQGPSNPGRVFFISSLWKKEPEANELRANFIRACKSTKNLRFEGGLVTKSGVGGFDDVAVQGRISLAEYIEKTRHSLAVFNTPAVAGCLGWKLAEYLALGKAIISTPLKKELPAPLEHGRHLHFVEGSAKSISDALELMQKDETYRRRLEDGAREYYETYLSPAKVVSRVLHRAGVCAS
jgi:hypothetical protein